MRYSAEGYESVFTGFVSQEDPRKELGHMRVASYRTQEIISGPVMEIKSYPVWTGKNEASRAREGRQKTREAQAKLNEKNAKAKIARRANATFTERDIFLTLTYQGAAPDEVQARRDMQNYLRRLRAYRQKHGLPEMAYLYVVEFEQEGEHRKRIHHHVIMSDMDRDEAERLWDKGRVNSKRLQPDKKGLEGLVMYMLKAKRATRRCACSRNCKEPVIKTSDRKISMRKVERMAAGLPEVAQQIFERAYPSYEYVDLRIRRSDFVAGAYVNATMYKREDNLKDTKWMGKSKAETNQKARCKRKAGKKAVKKSQPKKLPASRDSEVSDANDVSEILIDGVTLSCSIVPMAPPEMNYEEIHAFEKWCMRRGAEKECEPFYRFYASLGGTPEQRETKILTDYTVAHGLPSDEVRQRIRDLEKPRKKPVVSKEPAIEGMSRDEFESFQMWCSEVGEERHYARFYEFFKTLADLEFKDRIGYLIWYHHGMLGRYPSDGVVRRLEDLSRLFDSCSLRKEK